MSGKMVVSAEREEFGFDYPRPRRGPAGTAKRIFDLTVALSMLVLFAPLMIAIALLIMVADGRPIVFAHRRVGFGGRSFLCLKFRTMVRDSEAVLQKILDSDPEKRREWEETQKLVDDPRVIGSIGRFMRRTSLDELPQIFNVLRGEMSIVGPRPVVQAELIRYGELAKAYRSVRPGLTGPWQIGGRSQTTYDERVAIDAAYIGDWSLTKDAVIVAKTVKMLAGSHSAV